MAFNRAAQNEKPYTEGEPELNLLWLSQQLPDVRTPGVTGTSTAAAAGGAGSK